MSLLSISKISELTGFDRRTVKARLDGLVPVVEGRAHLYDTRDALPLLYGLGGPDGNYDLTEERARLAHHQANNEKLKEDQLRGSLIPAELIVEFGSAMVVAARAKLLALHSKIKNRFPELPQATVDEIQDYHHEALEELGNDGVPSEIRERIRGHLERLETPADSDDQ